jgi:hypothetical protein
MATSTDTTDSAAGPSSAGATGSQPERDPEQETVETPDGLEFLHAGSGNSLGSGLNTGGKANIASRDGLPDSNAEGEPEEKNGSASSEDGLKAQP